MYLYNYVTVKRVGNWNCIIKINNIGVLLFFKLMAIGHIGVSGYLVMRLVVEGTKYDIETAQIQHLQLMVTHAVDHLLKTKHATHLLAQVMTKYLKFKGWIL